MTTASKDRRDALLSELESIRTMLEENSHVDNIPLLIPENHSRAADRIPVLSIRAAEGKPTAPVVDPLHAIRQAAAKVVANTVRHRDHVVPTLQTPAPAPTSTPTVSEREKLVDDIVRGALPRLESLLRELVQEALLQEKLRGGKR